MAPQSSVVAQMRVSRLLRERRAELNLPAREVAKRLGVTPTFYSSWENYKATPATNRLAELTEILELNETQSSDLASLLIAARANGWWSEYADLLSEESQAFYALEYGASRIHIYEPTIVTGLLQTRAYAEATVRSAANVAPVTVQRFVELRLRRQPRLRGEDRLVLVTVMSEAALAQVVGSREILLDQLVHLMATIESPETSVSVRIQPFAEPKAGLSNATVALLEVEGLPTLAYREAGRPVGVDDDPRLTAEFTVGFEAAVSASLSEADSLALIESHIRRLEAG